MHIKNARTTLTVDASQRLRPWTMPVHFNELRYPWNANDAKINLTNLHSHLRKKSPSPLNTAGCTRRKTNKKKARLFTLSLSPTTTRHICSHTQHERLRLLLQLQKCKFAARHDSQETRRRWKALAFPLTEQSKVRGVEPKAVNTSLRFWYGTLRRCSTDASAT